jgi:acyl dehydratase
MTNYTFEELVDEWVTGTQRQIREKEEVMEGYHHLGYDAEKQAPTPEALAKVPFVAPRIADQGTILKFAHRMGDDNPLYTDPAYAATSRYGTIIAPPTMVPTRQSHGYGGAGYAPGAKPYPLNNMWAGNCWEWFDAIYLGDRFRSNCIPAELINKKGRTAKRGIYFVITESHIWNFTGLLICKSYGTKIEVPNPGRMDPERIGEEMLYERGTYRYSQDEIKNLVSKLEAEERRGAEPRYWEDVEVGDPIPPVVKGPFTIGDLIGHGGYRSWEIQYHSMRERTGEARVNPITRWPWGPESEHEDVMLCRYRGFPGPFDAGALRAMLSVHPLTNWAGDDGFVRKQYTQIRRPNFYGDATIFEGEVVQKYEVTEKGEDAPGAIPGEYTYAAVDVRIKGINQIGEVSTPTQATIYLPSRELGPVQLPIPHVAKPPYLPFGQYFAWK